MEIARRASHKTMEDEEERSPKIQRASVKDADDIDVDILLARCRSTGRRRRRQLYQAPEFVKRLNAFEEVKAGSTVAFECRWQALPRPTIKWYQDDEEITENNRFRFEDENGCLKLVIADCKKSDEGAYKCKAENAEGVASTTGYLSVTGDIKEKILSAQPRKNAQHAVSNPPRLRAIVEQKSLELREEEEYMALPPSPINDFIETFQRSQIWPQFCTASQGPTKEADVDDSGSDTSVESQDYDHIPYEVPDCDRYARENGPETEYIEAFEGRHHADSANDSYNGTCVRDAQCALLTNESACQLMQKLNPDFPFSSDAKNTTAISEDTHGTVPNAEVISRGDRSKPVPSDEWQVTNNDADFPWLFCVALSSIATFVATATDISPSFYVILLAIISLLSFRIVISEKATST